MVIAASRAYRDAARWMRHARGRRSSGARLARRAFAFSLVSGLGVMSSIALVAPDRFGAPGRGLVHTGWPALVLGGFVAVAVVAGLVKHRELAWALRRAREPFVRPLDEYEAFEGAGGALAACPAWLQSRFAATWIIIPAVLAVLAAACAWSAAYFTVDATLSRFDVRWGHPLLGAVFLVLALALFRIAAARLAVVRLAFSVYKSVTTGY